jgi:YidC/Oxa1 family membrane protein insertase
MNENKNLILALALMVGVWFLFNTFFPQQQPQQAPQTAAVEQSSVEKAPDAPAIQPERPAVPLLVENEDIPARLITVESDKYRAVFTTAGARLVSFELKDYQATSAADIDLVQMYTPGPRQYASLRTTGTEGFALSPDALFTLAQKSDLLQVPAGDTAQLDFRYVNASGVDITKSFVFSGDKYTIEHALTLRNGSASALRGTLDFALVQRWDESLKPDSYTFAGPASLVGESVEEEDVDDLAEKPIVYGQDLTWTSFQTKYFLSAVVPQEQSTERTRIIRRGEAVENILESPYFTLQSGESRQLDYFLFIGPKDLQQLKAADHQLEKAIHFGFFDILAKPLYFVLTFFYGFLQNYGLAIILLTVIIKLIFWPLTHKSYSSMKAMQKLQPEMQKVRERFKDDKERLNRELMELYKTHRVNPLGGCLPMLVQIPVFFALYKVLLDSIELRHAPFAFWLTDLSAKDPYYITPLLMGASMFVQQKMTPSTADPTQAKIFMMMPVIFTFLFLNFPCGLVIYWLVNNLLTILQQYYIHRKSS